MTAKPVKVDKLINMACKRQCIRRVGDLRGWHLDGAGPFMSELSATDKPCWSDISPGQSGAGPDWANRSGNIPDRG